MMKKNLKFLGGCLAVALALTACSHDHIPGPVTAGKDDHTYTCTDCGEFVTAAHKLDEDNFCEGCNSNVYIESDGSVNVTTFDEQGNMKTDIFYDENGNVSTEVIYETEYDENGNEVSCKIFENGILTRETSYETIDIPNLYAHYITQTIEYTEEGRTVTIYADTMLNEESVTFYDADGNVITQTTYEYTKDENDNILGRVAYTDGVVSEEYHGFVDAEGCFRYHYNKFYEGGELVESYTYEYELNSVGLVLAEQEFWNGVLNRECRYTVDEDGYTHLITEIYYDENGNVSEEYNYDDNGEAAE